jgi:hypothetical protein
MTTETVAYRRPLGGQVVGDDLLLPIGSEGVPLAVAEANATCLDAFAAWRESLAVVRDARDAVKSAPYQDQRRDASALEAGKPLPAERLEPQARIALGDAVRQERAAHERLRDCEHAFCEIVRQHHEAWSTSQAEAVANARQAARDASAAVAQSLTRLQAERSIENGLRDFPLGGYFDGARFWKPSPRERESARARALELVATPGSHSAMYSDPDMMLAALDRLIDQG